MPCSQLQLVPGTLEGSEAQPWLYGVRILVLSQTTILGLLNLHIFIFPGADNLPFGKPTGNIERGCLLYVFGTPQAFSNVFNHLKIIC